MSFRAVVTDLDGTLLDAHHSISEYTLKTLNLLREKGVAIVFATGRPHMDVFHTIDTCNLHGCYLITSNGTRVFDPQRRVIAEHYLDPQIVKELINIQQNNKSLESCFLSINVFRHDQWLTNNGIKEMLQIFQRSGFCYNCTDLSKESHDGVNSVFFVGDERSLLIVEDILNSQFQEKVNHSFSMSHVLDVSPPNVHKGNAMREVAELLGITLKDIIAFGDGMNDAEMLKMAGKGCVMGNAQQRLKAALPDVEVIGLNTEDAVAKKLCEVFEL